MKGFKYARGFRGGGQQELSCCVRGESLVFILSVEAEVAVLTNGIPG